MAEFDNAPKRTKGENRGKCEKGEESTKNHNLNKQWLLPVWFLQKMIEMMLELCDRKLPETGGFHSFHIAFSIPETENLDVLEIECLDSRVPDARLLKTISLRKGTDYQYNHYLKKGSSAEIRAYLRDAGNLEEIYDSIHELSDSVEKHWM